jgi:hypothetical protein
VLIGFESKEDWFVYRLEIRRMRSCQLSAAKAVSWRVSEHGAFNFIAHGAKLVRHRLLRRRAGSWHTSQAVLNCARPAPPAAAKKLK